MKRPDDEYATLRMKARAEWKVQGSRFLAVAMPVGGIEEIEEIIAAIRKDYFDATHHCYAYRLGADREGYRTYDDGEPSGSSGKPILSAIDKAGVTDVLVVVTRYFGGTKLGVGGLVRAYGRAAELALAGSEKIVRHIVGYLEIAVPHDRIGGVMHVVGKTGARVADTHYDEAVHFRLVIRRSRLAELRAALVEQTSGNVSITIRAEEGRE